MTDNRKPRTLKEYLDDMQRSVNRLTEISGVGEAVFKTNEDKQDAAIRHIEVLGEIASKLLTHYPSFVLDNGNIPFRDMSDMRNKLIHNYFGVNLDGVWKVIKNNIPALNEQLSTLVISHKNSIPKGRGLKL